MFLKKATAAQSRLVGPFVSDSDFKTVQTGLTIANTDVKLSANGAAGASKNSGGGTHRNNGMYGLTFDATDTATVGELAGSVVVTGALPVAFKFFVVESVVYDAWYAASAVGYITDQPVNTTKINGTAQTARDLGASVLLSTGTGTGQLDFTSGVVKANATQILGTAVSTPATAGILDVNVKNMNNVAGTAITTIKAVQGLTTADTIATYTGNTVQTGDSFARLGAPAGASVSADVAAVRVDTQLVTTTAQSELAAVPASNAAPLAKLNWLFLLARNKLTQTATTQIVKANDGSTTVGTSTVSDDGTTATRGVFS